MTISATGNRMTSEIARQSKLAQDISRTQISISTKKRIQIASDDPVAAARVATITRAQSDNTTYSGNLSLGASLASQADSALGALSDHMTRARELMIAGASSTATAADRATYAQELRGIAADVAELRATKTSLDQPLFSTGAPTQFRVANGVLVTPVDSAANIFERSGVALTQDLTDAAAALEGGNATTIGTALDRIGTAVSHVADAAGDQGVRAARIDKLIDRNSATAIDMAAERSGLEDTDLTSAIAQLNAQQLTLDAAQAAFARINRRTLFDILN
jgi:flagellar hook-associated protein 3 FlgL